MLHSTPVRQSGDTTLDMSIDAGIVIDSSTAFFTPNQPQRVSRLFDMPAVVEEGLTQEQIILALRTMIAAQQDIAIQFDIDLEARDEAVEILTTRLNRAKEERDAWREEAERRASSHRRLKHKVSELEQLCRSLEDDVEKSREESFERSIMDAASGSALQHLHQTLHELESARAALDAQVRDAEIRLERESERVQALTRDNNELRDTEDGLRKELAQARDAEIQLDGRVRELEIELERRSSVETSFHAQSSQLQALRSQVHAAQEREIEGQSGYEQLMSRVRDLQQASEVLKQYWHEKQAAWDEDRLILQQDAIDRLGKLNTQIDNLKKQNDDLHTSLEGKESKLTTMRDELEAQWKSAEDASERIIALKRENRDYQEMIQDLEEQRLHLEEDKARLEERLQEQSAELHELMDGRSEANRQVEAERRNAEDLARLLDLRQNELNETKRERQSALDDLIQTRKVLNEREADDTYHISALEEEADTLREHLTQMKATLEDSKRSQQRLSDLEKRKAEEDLATDALRASIETLKEESISLRQQVRELQHKNSDQNIEITQLQKDLLDMTDMASNLNMSLEAKQQELELMKRKEGVRGTAGMTPAPATVVRPASRASIAGRRESAMFTPLPVSRPPSSASITSSSAAKPTLQKERKPSISTATNLRRTGSSASESGSVNTTARKPSIDSTPDAMYKRPLGVSKTSNAASASVSGASKHAKLSSVEGIGHVYSASAQGSYPSRSSIQGLASALRASRVPTLSPPSTSKPSPLSPPSSKQHTSPRTIRRVSNPISRLNASRSSDNSLMKTPTPANKENSRPQAVPAA